MNQKLKLTVGKVSTPGFSEAFARLGQDTISVKARYALARTANDIDSHYHTYEQQRIELVKKHGVPEIELLRSRRERLAADASEANAAKVKALDDRISTLTASGEKSIAVDNEDSEKFNAYMTALRQLKDVEFEVFLSEKIQLPDDSKLSASDISLLIDLVEVAG